MADKLELTRAVFTSACAKTWRYLRQITGDAAYENYLRHCALETHPERTAKTMTRGEFYTDSLRRRYSGISRCC
ncbi:MAG: YbdD/YjiX family protein [Candidatus Acidiferrales bacterium]